MSVSERKAMLEEAEVRWMENYQLTLAEWHERNQVFFSASSEAPPKSSEPCLWVRTRVWVQFEAEQYDLSSALTPVQSRLEALKQQGMLV